MVILLIFCYLCNKYIPQYINIMSIKSNKNSCFEYIVDTLIQKNNGSSKDFSTLKLIKLLFFVVGVSSTDTDSGLTGIFNHFFAMPYGPVESDIYNTILAGELTKYIISPSGCELKADKEINIDESLKNKIEAAVSNLLQKNPNILKCQPFELVDISHKWSCWRICYNIALSNEAHSIEIPSEMIQNSVKYYQ